MIARMPSAALAAAALLSACGGGGGGGGGPKSGDFTLDADAVRLTLVPFEQTIPRRELLMTVTGIDAVYAGAGFASGTQPYWLNLDVQPAGNRTFRVIVSLTSNFLDPGEYAATFQVGTADAAGNVLATRDVRVTAVVAAVEVTPDTILLGGADGIATGPRELSVRLVTGTARTHPFEIALEPAGGWLQASATSGTVGDAGRVISLDADHAAVPPGTHRGLVRVTVTWEGRRLVHTIPVTLNVEEHRLVVGEAGVGFTASPGRSVLQRDVGVFDSLGQTVGWVASADQPWLSVTPAGLTGEKLRLTADPAGLEPGTHFAGVTVSPTDPAVSNVQTIRVGLTVRSAAPADVSISAVAAHLAASPVEPLVFAAAGGTSVVGYDVDTGAVARTLADVGGKVDGIAVSPDGRFVYVFDRTTGKTSKRDAVTGALLLEFPPPASTYVYPNSGMLAFRPAGHEVLVTGYGTAFDAETGAALRVSNPEQLARAYAMSATPDGVHVAGSSGFAKLRYTALGEVRLHVVDGEVGPFSPRTEQGCITADGARYYRAYAECGSYGYAFCGWDVATRAPVASLPGKAYPAAIACAWNGLVIAGTDAFYDGWDLYFYDQSGTSIGTGNSSRRADRRSLLAHGLAVSADGARLVSLSRPSMGYDPSDEIRFQTLPGRP